MKHLIFVALTALALLAGTAASAQEKKVQSITKAEFLEKVVNYEKSPDRWKYLGDRPAIVDFYADWCRPCKQLAPVLEEIAREYGDRIVVYKVNTDKEQELAAAFGIQSIPTLFFIPREGDPQATQGVLPKEELVRLIEKILLP